MSRLEQILAANREFMRRLPEEFVHSDCAPVTKTPSRGLAIFTCMDTRLVDFLEPAMGIRRGEAKMIKNAGNSVTGPFEATIRSLVVAIFELGVEEVMVIGHKDCGIANTSAEGLKSKMLARGISPDALYMVDQELTSWIDRFHHPCENVREVVARIRTNPLIPKDVPIHGLMFDPQSGEIEILVDGYEGVAK
ncbi:carbonic anhydrase [Heliobacterium gestii]|uniref:carbonic anhydrase n=1 Tax=Heliomicrobium gestii TaxID=2699 RepID=A0A845LLE3_HELGE|nr:carbonic anhydrase [Heliomicrobium gestii]MBM7867810.1 carbonic anhydrase [Heliomicrobium gestii]MZP44203.1 carbonic anhydrase [Heliomicrobium gestii]